MTRFPLSSRVQPSRRARRPTPWRAALSLAVSLLISAGGPPAIAKEEPIPCEINFSALPHHVPANQLSLQQERALHALATNPAEAEAFLKSVSPVAAGILSTVAPALSVDIRPVWGGYRGHTGPSLAAHFPPTDKANRLAAALGYVFFQDSVLVQCPTDDAIETPAYWIEEGEESDLLNQTTLKSLYGMMIGEADGDLHLGFTYYPQADRFLVLALSDRPDYERGVVTALDRQLRQFSEGRADITLLKGTKSVRFLANDWRVDPKGKHYAETYLSDDLVARLSVFRAQYLSALDALAVPPGPASSPLAKDDEIP
ncbi:hypothetical protein PB2503_11599 [Parvularcula bermudensis HTCC2503]|uniref:Uncharacterized protein n=1 Tax=Parvularcula bermudensis (strain ATCC BAA-594 / HTCC2503 / KCTC 12087) TaxID=314260 RepID=E0TCY2_PARBH|nr:hypothetical protein [Parvularcula bermudensis]ADM10365.1 hypothetical protein PB2503_11599 [Parvularcula bermudensis HTCC2503]